MTAIKVTNQEIPQSQTNNGPEGRDTEYRQHQDSKITIKVKQSALSLSLSLSLSQQDDNKLKRTLITSVQNNKTQTSLHNQSYNKQ